MTDKYTTQKIGHHKLAASRVAEIEAIKYRFRKVRVYGHGESATEVPFSEDLVLLKVRGRRGGEDKVLWLTDEQRGRVLEALQEVGPFGSEAKQLQLLRGAVAAPPAAAVAAAVGGVAA